MTGTYEYFTKTKSDIGFVEIMLVLETSEGTLSDIKKPNDDQNFYYRGQNRHLETKANKLST